MRRAFSTLNKTVLNKRAMRKNAEMFEYKLPVWDKVAYDTLMTEILRGSMLVFQQLFSPPVTIMYPQEKVKIFFFIYK
jgi:hypothetical protein